MTDINFRELVKAMLADDRRIAVAVRDSLGQEVDLKDIDIGTVCQLIYALRRIRRELARVEENNPKRLAAAARAVERKLYGLAAEGQRLVQQREKIEA